MSLYKQLTVLSREAHNNLRVRRTDFGFAANQQTAPIAGIEFMRCAADHPIVFIVKDDGSVYPFAVMSLESGKNVHVGSDGNWDDTYAPAFFRQYPFALSEEGTVCFDAASEAISESSGEALFNGDAYAEKLQLAIKFLSECQAAGKDTSQVCNKIADLDILKPWTINVSQNGVARASITGFSVIAEKKLSEVRQRVLTSVNCSAMGWVYAHLVSLAHFEKLAKKLTAG